MTTLEILTKAQEILSTSWNKEFLAKGKRGPASPCGDWVQKDTKSDEKIFIPATHWSIVGALMKAEETNRLPNLKAVEALQKFITPYRYISQYEDPDKSKEKRSLDQVLELFDKAIGSFV